MTLSRQQEYMMRALTDVQEVLKKSPKVQKRFGALCHQLPPMVMANGLGLTMAYIHAKKSKAHFGLAETYLARLLLGDGAEASDLVGHVVNPPSVERYMLDTFTVLDAWVYYQRFSESLLKVKPGDEAEEDGDDEDEAAEGESSDG